MLHDFLSVNKSRLANLSKKGFAKAGLFTTVVLASVSISTGLMPINVAGVTNLEVAEAQACQTSMQGYTAWWGVYARLNQCATNKLAYHSTKGAIAASLGALFPNPTSQAVSVLVAGGIGLHANKLQYCANNYGQSYVKIGINFTELVWQRRIVGWVNVSCT